MPTSPIPTRGSECAARGRAHDALAIRYAGSGPLSVEVFDVRGARVERVVEAATSAGSATWQPEGTVAPGIYFVRLAGRGFEVVRRVARVR